MFLMIHYVGLFHRHFTKLAVDAVIRLKGSGNLKAIQIMKISGGLLEESFLDEGFLLNKKVIFINLINFECTKKITFYFYQIINMCMFVIKIFHICSCN